MPIDAALTPLVDALTAAQTQVSVVRDTYNADVAALTQQVQDALAAQGADDTALAAAQAQVADLSRQLADCQSATPGQTYVRPSGAGYVRWEDLYNPGDNLQAVMDRAGPTAILTFPADEIPVGVDFYPDGSSKGYKSVVRLTCRGLAGSGEGRTRLVMPKTTSKTQSTPTSGPPLAKLIDMSARTQNPYFGGFTLAAEDVLGANGLPLLFNGITTAGTGLLVEHLDLQHAHRGNKNAPPGETGGLATVQVTGGVIRDVTIDCRDDSGARVGTSPFMGNNTTNLLIERLHAHHAYAGTVTFWRCSGITTRRLRSERNGSGDGSGVGINHELCSGSIRHEEPVILTPSSFVMSASSSEASALITVVDPVTGPGDFRVWSAATYLGKPEAQRQSDITVTRGGQPVPLRFG